MLSFTGLSCCLRSSVSKPSYFYRRPLRDTSNWIQRIPMVLSTANYRACNYPPSDNIRKHQVVYKPYVPVVDHDHDHKNMMLNRPMSPHLNIYGPTLPAMTSIMQRITGVALTAYAITLSVSTLMLPQGIHTLVDYIQSWNLPEPVVIGIKTILALTFTYHYFIGVRFVMFSFGKWLRLKEAYASAYLSIVLALAGGVACALIGHVYELHTFE